MTTRKTLPLLFACLALVSTGCSDDDPLLLPDAAVTGGDLTGGDLTGGDLSGSDLKGSDLPGIDGSAQDGAGDAHGADSAVPDAGGQLPAYSAPALRARTNMLGNPGGAFNVPEGHLFSGEDVQLNGDGLLCFRITVNPQVTKQIWCGAAGVNGAIVYTSPADAFMLSPSLNNADRVVFELADVTTPGVYFYDHTSGTSGFLTNEPLGTMARSGLQISDSGVLSFRASIGPGGALVTVDGSTVTYYIKETSLDPASPYEYLFAPDLNQGGQLASAARKGPGIGESQPDEIRLWNADGSSSLVAQDSDADPASIYAGFDATRVSLNDKGQVAFVATLTSGERAVVLSDGIQTRTIATDSQAQISEIEFFGASVNNDGLVVFRGRDGNGLQCIFIGNGTDLKCLIKEHDLVTIDQGQARIEQHDDTYPVFGGRPAINVDGDVAFNAGVTPADDKMIEWGTGVFVLEAQ